MRKILFSLTLLIVASMSTGCTHALHMVQSGDLERIPTGREFRRVKSEADQFVVMGFVSQTDFANQAYARLAQQCPKGEVTGIQTRYSTSHGFFSWTNKIKMQGYCLE